MSASTRKRVEDVMTTHVETISRNATVSEAVRKMREHEINSLLVPGSETGIITSTDVLDAVAAERDLKESRVSNLMTSPVESVNDEVQLREAAAMMTTYGINHLPVRDSHGDYIGIVSSADIRATLGDSAIEE
jgi:signal-transduction protein with cAMP-binding, CBS, and nucleotidyltransferase domain